MSHVYQPVMLKRLLIGSGTAKVEEIALDLVQNDLSQIEYYTDRVHNMVGRVLRKNGLVDRDKSVYLLRDYQTLNNHEIQELIDICDEKIKDYIQKRDLTIWDPGAETPHDRRFWFSANSHESNPLCDTLAELFLPHCVPNPTILLVQASPSLQEPNPADQSPQTNCTIYHNVPRSGHPHRNSTKPAVRS